MQKVICDLVQAYTPVSGGIRTYIEQKKNYLAENTDWHHVLIYPSAEDRITEEKRSTTIELKAPLLPGYAPYRALWRADRIYTALKQVQPDIIELGSPYIMPWTAFRFRKRHNCHVVGFYHTDFGSAYLQPQKLNKTIASNIGRLTDAYQRAVYNRCEFTLTASHCFYDQLQTKGVKRLKRITLGTDLDCFSPEKRSIRIRSRLGIVDNDLAFIYSGRFDHEKRVVNIAKAFRRLPSHLPFHLIMIGDGPLKQELQYHSFEDTRISILPYQTSRRSLSSLLASADIYVTAGPHETFGLSVLEAQASGLPVIGVRAGALTERIPENAGILVEPDNVDLLAAAMQRMVESNIKTMGFHARHLAESNHNWTAIFLRIKNLYTQLLQKSVPASGHQFAGQFVNARAFTGHKR